MEEGGGEGTMNEEERQFFDQLFAIYDTDSRGFIDTDRFIEVTKQRMDIGNGTNADDNDQQVRDFFGLFFLEYKILITILIS